jgi:nitrogen fixation protein NifU and related proteins
VEEFGGFMSYYSSQVLEHFQHPRNVGELAEANRVAGASNPVCGDALKLWGMVRAGRLEEVSFKVQGCVPSVACGSWLTEAVRGKPLTEIISITPEQIVAGLGGLPIASSHAAVLACEALRQLLAT